MTAGKVFIVESFNRSNVESDFPFNDLTIQPFNEIQIFRSY